MECPCASGSGRSNLEKQVPYRGRIERIARLAPAEQQVKQFTIRQRQQFRQRAGFAALEPIALPVEEPPQQQVVLEQAAPRPPPQPPHLFGRRLFPVSLLASALILDHDASLIRRSAGPSVP
jgi:hypothetical protein